MELAVRVDGDGDAVLFLHAFPLNSHMWSGQVTALADRFRLVRPDARGFGASPPTEEDVLAMEQIADDAVAALDQIGIARAVVVGCSMGGYAALALVRRHPERVRALVLQDTRAGPDDDEARRGRLALAKRVQEEGTQPAVEAFLPKLLGKTSHARRPELVERVRHGIESASPRGISAALHGMAMRVDSRPMLGGIGVPTLLIVGAEDTVTPPSESEAMQSAIPGSQLAVIPSAGHLSNLENPEAYEAALLAFLDALPA